MIPQNVSLCIRFLCGVIAISSTARLDAAPTNVAAAQASTGFVDVDGGKLYYEESNHGGLTVVLLHDGVVDSAVWNDVWPAFCQHFHAVRYDRRGFGKSPASTSWYSEIDDAAALFHHLHLGRAALVGSSHGGQLAVDFALARPEFVEELVGESSRRDSSGNSKSGRLMPSAISERRQLLGDDGRVEAMNADGSEQLKFVEGGAELLDRIEPLWKQQTALRAEKSLRFAESFTTASFSDRKSVFRAKGANRYLVGQRNRIDT